MVPNNPGCLQSCLNHVVRNRSSIKKYLRNRTTENRLKFTQYRNKFKLIRKECESRYYLHRFSECTNNLIIGVIARIKQCLPPQTLLNLYYTLIFHYSSYCNIIWGCNYKTYLQNLFTVQKRAIRLISDLPRYSSSKASFRKLNLLTLENINRYQILLFMFRYHHNLLPKSF